MGGFLRRNELNAFVSQSACVNPLEQSLSPAQQDRRESDVQLIDEARTKILLDRARSAANAYIHSVGCVARPVKRLGDRAGCPPTSLSSSCPARNREPVRTCFFRESMRQHS